MVYAKFGGQTECIMGNSKIVNSKVPIDWRLQHNDPELRF